MSKVILIGGAPATGKSYLARKLSEELKLPWISTDGLRGIMREITKPEDYPAIFAINEHTVTAEAYLTSHTPQQIVDEQIAESQEVWRGVEALIATDYIWQNYIVEGIAILPSLVAKLKQEDLSTKAFFLVDEDVKRIEEIVYQRGVWDYADTYSDTVKPIEVQWVSLFNNWLKEGATQCNLPIVTVKDRDQTLSTIIAESQQFMQSK